MQRVLKTRQITSLLTILLSVKMLFSYPRYVIERCENGAWISLALYGLLSVGILAVTLEVYKKSERKSILTIAEYIGGKWLKILVGIVSIVLIIMNIAPMVRAFPEAIKTTLLQNASMEFIIIFISFGVLIGAYYGLRAISKVSSLFLPVAAIFIAVFLILLIPYFKVNNLFPISFQNIITQGSTSLSAYSDIFLLTFLVEKADSYETVKKSGFAALGLSILTGVVITLIYALVYPYPASARFIIPLQQLARIVKIGIYFQRLEAVFEFVWSISILIYTSAYLCIMCDILKHSLDLRDTKPLILPLLLILLSFAFFEQNYVKTVRANFVSSMVLFIPFYLLPLVLGLIFIIKERHTKRERKNR